MTRILAALLAVLSASPCLAWTIHIKNGSVTYDGRPLGNEIVYTVKGKQAGTARPLGNEVVYRDAAGQPAGSVRKLGNDWVFKDRNGAVIGTAVFYGQELVYKDARGRQTGSARVLGGKTEYRNERNMDIGSADTDSMPLRPLPLEKIIAENTIPVACLTRVSGIALEMPAAAAGLRAGDIIIGFEGQPDTVFKYQKDDCSAMHRSVVALVNRGNKADSAMIVYRPASGEHGTPQGQILKTLVIPQGKRGFNYQTADSGPSYTQKESVAYAAAIKKLYEAGDFTAATVSIPGPDSAARDTRNVSGAHQEFREEIVNNAPRIGWYWVSDKDGRVLTEEAVKGMLDREKAAAGARIFIRSYPGARIYMSTQTSEGSGDPALSNKYRLIGTADMNGVFHYSGNDYYTLPAGARGLAFSAAVYDVDMAAVMQDPRITGLPANSHQAVRDAMILQVMNSMAAAKGKSPEMKFGYLPLQEGKTEYSLK
ncbi:hypothetical protein [Succinimonas amylolytica]|uniref:hypothetical protein n=1 Tax=Succinimonas amylolytica TaxID=83769 RepID=UPI0023A85FE4